MTEPLVHLKEDEWFFPYNIVDILGVGLAQIDPDVFIVQRPLIVGDSDLTIGITPAHWQPVEQSREIGHRPRHEPTLNRYEIFVQGIVHDMEEERGIRRHSQFARAIRSVLYRDTALQVALRSEAVTDTFGVVERVADLTIESQEFDNNNINDFVYLSTMKIIVTTEIQST